MQLYTKFYHILCKQSVQLVSRQQLVSPLSLAIVT